MNKRGKYHILAAIALLRILEDFALDLQFKFVMSQAWNTQYHSEYRFKYFIL